MLISFNWLRELTNTGLRPNELRERLTMVGLAIDAVDTHADDSVLDVEVPSNRPDCLSHVGIAREVSVIDRKQLNLPAAGSVPMDGRSADLTSVEIKDPDLCPRYAARLVRGVKIGPSPDWLTKRLEAIGQRPINNVADITNYVLHEVGQPLHAFDFNKLGGQRIVVRRAARGEKLRTLDGLDRELTDEMLVIADAERAVALAGIMGGEESEISPGTTDVLIESAYFDPNSVRRTARRLGMDTEASRRFERGADRENVLRAQQRCVELICELAGGVATEDAVDVYPQPYVSRIIEFRTARVKELTSLTVKPDEMVRILTGLGFKSDYFPLEKFSVEVPSWRIDVEQQEDLVEEIARHSGYDKIASELPPSNIPGEYQPSEMQQRSLRRALNACGFDEAITFSFISREEQFELIPALSEQGQTELQNPIIEDATWMRSSLMTGLMNSLRHNLNHGIRDVRLFEIGRVFGISRDGEVPDEPLALGMIATGAAVEENRAQADREIDFFDVKGAVEAAVDWMNLSPLIFTSTTAKHLRAGQAAAIKRADGIEIGTIGRLAEAVASAYKFRQPVYVMELDLGSLLSGPQRVIQYSPLPRYPSVMRDISLLLSRTVSLDEILTAVRNQRVADCRNVTLVGTFAGGNIPANKRSVTLRLEYRSDERTLRDEEVEERHSQLTSSLLQTFAAEQR
ncbi:MAG TPA: phenylalanine--tRNA ligase subunit beta [Pyrinomonadaceae bacterium]|jgi:phenylalanyl-tRNA synthetase beta chain|nr:phenylalanine--tRNA ligase subunit beta [Pyrinomonadaceae bacterium]